MLKRLTLFLVIACCVACDKNQQKSAGCTAQICTDIFVSINIHFTDNTGKLINVQNFTAIDQRTHLALQGKYPITVPVPNTKDYLVADDSMLSQLSTDGDDILITATNPTTNQTKTVTLKISGGCNCHVAKISGVDTVAFV
jgi:hypothetical protein